MHFSKCGGRDIISILVVVVVYFSSIFFVYVGDIIYVYILIFLHFPHYKMLFFYNKNGNFAPKYLGYSKILHYAYASPLASLFVTTINCRIRDVLFLRRNKNRL